MIRTIAATAVVYALVASGAEAGPTFSKDVAPILYNNCTNCHRTGEIGPMSLLTYADARPWARSIATRVSNGTMPPWHADPAHGEYLNDRRLSASDKETILQWVSDGAPEGDPKELPPQPKYAEGWMIGQPDVVLAMQEDYPIPAAGTLEYKFFEVPTNFTEDKFIPGRRGSAGHSRRRASRHRLHAIAAAAAAPDRVLVRAGDEQITDTGANQGKARSQRSAGAASARWLARRLRSGSGGSRLPAGNGAARAGGIGADHVDALHG